MYSFRYSGLRLTRVDLLTCDSVPLLSDPVGLLAVSLAGFTGDGCFIWEPRCACCVSVEECKSIGTCDSSVDESPTAGGDESSVSHGSAGLSADILGGEGCVVGLAASFCSGDVSRARRPSMGVDVTPLVSRLSISRSWATFAFLFVISGYGASATVRHFLRNLRFLNVILPEPSART